MSDPIGAESASVALDATRLCVFEGTLRNRVLVRGRSYNDALYALTPKDFHEDEFTHLITNGCALS